MTESPSSTRMLMTVIGQVTALVALVKEQQAHLSAIEAYLRAQPSYNPHLLHALLETMRDDPHAYYERQLKSVAQTLQDLLKDFEGPPQ